MVSQLLAAFGANDRGIILFGFEIYYYALCIVAGIVTATCLSALLMKRRNMSPDFIFTLFVCCIPTALICARLFYCITDGMNIKYWFMWDDGAGHGIRNGGLSIIGGALGGIGMGLIVCLVKKISFLRAADCVVITILLAQAIGRWGNYFNREVYGDVVRNPSLQWFPFAVNIGGTWHYAFFFYEMLINLVGFSLLYAAAWYWTKKPNGVFTFAYFVWYGTVRAIMEPLRDPMYQLSGGGVQWSLVFSILMIAGGLAGIGVLLFLNYRREGSLFGSKRGDPCGITEYLSPYKDDKPYFSKINLLGANYPPMPEEETARYRRRKFFAKVKGRFSGGEDVEAPAEEPPQEPHEEAQKPHEEPSGAEKHDGEGT